MIFSPKSVTIGNFYFISSNEEMLKTIREEIIKNGSSKNVPRPPDSADASAPEVAKKRQEVAKKRPEVSPERIAVTPRRSPSPLGELSNVMSPLPNLPSPPRAVEDNLINLSATPPRKRRRFHPTIFWKPESHKDGSGREWTTLKYQCEICFKICQKPKAYENHIMLCKNDCKTVACKWCPYVQKSSNLGNHWKRCIGGKKLYIPIGEQLKQRKMWSEMKDTSGSKSQVESVASTEDFGFSETMQVRLQFH
ncbi:uncharacterized protein LOC26514501 [Drosophila ananassae]|uniref:uncharacterized protein LOC26514501 n=1 Tax=Drosophila ananassae TaxID=7217 RepID=UPI0013A5E837|nr:uncharacterized protein LOC26514501 [Drosophila ananassae]